MRRQPRLHRRIGDSEREELRKAARGTHDIRAMFGTVPPLPGASPPAGTARDADVSQGYGHSP
eukprot:5040732-Heterocapsa_arctica.AAC.1